MVSEFDRLNSLSIKDNNLREEAPKLAVCLNNLHNLTHLDISANNLGAYALQFIDNLRVPLQSLNLSENNLDEHTTDTLTALTKFTNLTSLSMTRSKLSQYPESAKTLAQLTGLTTLDISWNDLGSSIVEFVRDHPSLTSLDVSFNQAG